MPRINTAQETIELLEHLKGCLGVNYKTGVLTWKVRPRSYFRSERSWAVTNAQFAGKRAGSQLSAGHRMLELSYLGQRTWILAHRIIWAFAHDKWPEEEIDHRNGNPDDNRLENLREATHGQNAQNRKLNVNTTSGYQGVSLHKGTGRYQAYLNVNGKRINLGYFDTPIEAYRAREKAKKLNHSFQPQTRV